jgi:hypothetical protein
MYDRKLWFPQQSQQKRNDQTIMTSIALNVAIEKALAWLSFPDYIASDVNKAICLMSIKLYSTAVAIMLARICVIGCKAKGLESDNTLSISAKFKRCYGKG